MSARLLEQPNPTGGWPEIGSLTEMHGEEEGVRHSEKESANTFNPFYATVLTSYQAYLSLHETYSLVLMAL